MNINIVSVVNNFEQYNNLISDNNFIKTYSKIAFDNSIENIAITKRYNGYIDNSMPDNTWVVFCHQDFEFKEDIAPILENLDTSYIYGPIGATWKERFTICLHLSSKKPFRFRIGKTKRKYPIGEIWENSQVEMYKVGKYLHSPELVDTVDCCCIIIHSSLIKKYNLRFDENLDWHSYSEDFSLNAKVKNNILTKAVQINAIHHSKGSFNKGHEISLKYLRAKYKNMPFASTCYDGYYYNFINRIKYETN